MFSRKFCGLLTTLVVVAIPAVANGQSATLLSNPQTLAIRHPLEEVSALSYAGLYGATDRAVDGASPTAAGTPVQTASAVPSGAAAQERAWEFRLSPYLWAASLHVDANIGSRSADGTIDFGELLDHLDFAGLVHGEAQNDRWTIIGDALYLDLSDEFGRGSDVDLTLFIGEFAIAYQVLKGSMAGEKEWSIDVYGGDRYVYAKTKIQPVGLANSHSTRDFLDLMVGSRVKFDLTERIGLAVGGDIGGFDMGGSKLAWSAIGAMYFELTKHLRLAGGYRVLDFDFDGDTGSLDTELDIMLYGPFIGLTFVF